MKGIGIITCIMDKVSIWMEKEIMSLDNSKLIDQKDNVFSKRRMEQPTKEKCKIMKIGYEKNKDRQIKFE